MSESDMEVVGGSHDSDFLENDPTRQEKIEMRKAIKPPSQWLMLLCRDWALDHELIVETSDAKFLDFKPYLKGMLTSQLLCRLSIPSGKDGGLDAQQFDFWEILGVTDAFDRAYIVSQIERFCALYSIRAVTLEDDLFSGDLSETTALAAAAASCMNPSAGGYALDQSTAAALATTDLSKLSKKQIEVTKANLALENERRENRMREHRRLTQERKEQKARDREAMALRKANERATREASREERRKKKVEMRQKREKFAQTQKEAALRRAAELVASNRVPIEITRGAAAAKAAANAALVAGGVIPPQQPDQSKKGRSAIVVSTASDLHQIVTHAKNLWAKYNAIAKEHNQKVNWATVAKELGIHVKVREKYSRMHSRAEQRGFDWAKNGHWKIKDHPEIFMETTPAERQAKMPPPPPDHMTTVLIDGNKEVTEEAVAAAAAVVDASGAVVDSVVNASHDHEVAVAANVAATLVADPTAGFVTEAVSVKDLATI